MSSSSHEKRRGYRNDRIERAVAEAFECELLPLLEDPALQDLHVISVEVKNLACIHVLLGPGSGQPGAYAGQVEDALGRVENKLRMELASILRIKRMPLLRLRYVPLPLLQRPGGAV